MLGLVGLLFGRALYADLVDFPTGNWVTVPGPETGPPLADQVLLIVVEALTADQAANLQIFTQARTRGATGTLLCETPSYAWPNLVAMVAGTPPALSGILTDLHPGPATVDTLMLRVDKAGRTCAVAGSYAWSVLFPAQFTHNAPHRDFGDPTTDEQITREALGFLSQGAALVVADLGQADAAAHASHSLGPAYRQAVLRLDSEIGKLVAAVDLARTTVVVASTHGLTASGGHGGSEPEVLQVPVAMLGAGVKPGSSLLGSNRDLAPTLSVLLGLPYPADILATPLLEGLEVGDQAALERLAQEQARSMASSLLLSEGRDPRPDQSGLDALRERNRQRFLAGLAWRVPVAALILVLPLLAIRRLDRRSGWRSLLASLEWGALVALLFHGIVLLVRGSYSPSTVSSYEELRNLATFCTLLGLLLTTAVAFLRGFFPEPGRAAGSGLQVFIGTAIMFGAQILTFCAVYGFPGHLEPPDPSATLALFCLVCGLVGMALGAPIGPLLARLASRWPGRSHGVRIETAVLVLLLVLPVRAQVSPEFSLPGTPSLSQYSTELLPTYVNLDPELTQAYSLLVDFRFNEALEVLERLLAREGLDRGVKSEALTYAGYIHHSQRQSEKAKEALLEAIELNPANATAHFFLANEYYVEGDREKTRAELERAVELRPTFVSALRMLAESYRDAGRLADTLEYYQAIAKLLPGSGYYRYQLFRAQREAGRYAQAEESMLKLMEFEPGFLANYWRLAELYFEWYERDRNPVVLEKAEGVLRTLAERDPGSYQPYVGLARIALYRQQVDRARQELQTASTLAPGNQDVEEMTELVDRRERELRQEFWRRSGVAGGGAVLLFLLLLALGLARRRQQVLSVLSRFNEEVEDMTDLDTFSRSCTGFLSRELDVDKASLLLYIPQEGNLVEQGEPGGDQSPIRLVTGKELSTWTLHKTEPILLVDELLRDRNFSRAFPSLAERLSRRGFRGLVPLREGAFLRGLVALGWKGSQSKGRRQADLLAPLAQLITQSTERLNLYEATLHDEMTGLANRRSFNKNLTQELRRADRYRQPCSVILFDIDNFKVVNDTYGHPQGDRVLIELSELVKKSLREGIDTAARTGGEEFSIILPATPLERAVATAERIRAICEEHKFGGFPAPHPITLSLGVATYPDHAVNEKDLLKLVDEAQYLAKRSGKNRVSAAGSPEERGEAALQSVSPSELNILDRDTGLYNASYLGLRLADELRRSGRTQKPLSLIMLGIDGWDDLPVAERAQRMRQLGGLFRQSLRDGIDVPAFFRDGEVCVLLPETDLENAFFVGERLRARSQSAFTACGGTISGGVASYPVPINEKEPMALLEAAYRAFKRAQGEKNSVFCSPPDDPEV